VEIAEVMKLVFESDWQFDCLLSSYML